MPAEQLDALCFIQEQTSFMEDYDSFNYEVIDKGNRFYVLMDAILQSFGITNRNGREYDCDNIWNCIQTDDYIQSMLRQNSWLGEIDHPAAEKDGQSLTSQRVANPNMRLSSHYIRKPHLTNGRKFLEAKIQTDSSNENGMNMAIKIVDGKIIPCFSARVFGALQNKNGRAVVFVRKLITYDWVLYPSHPEALAKINQPIQESVDHMEHYGNCKIIRFPELAKLAANNSKETEWLCESFGLDINSVIGVTDTGNSVVIQENQNIYVQPISDKGIRRRTQSLVSDWINK